MNKVGKLTLLLAAPLGVHLAKGSTLSVIRRTSSFVQVDRRSFYGRPKARCVGPYILTSVRQVVAMSDPAKQVLVPVANGTEEMEAVIIIDVLRRAGAHVTVASVEDGLEVLCSRKVKLVADALIGDVKDVQYDLIALPGGMPGAERLRDSGTLTQMLEGQRAGGRFWTAICASPAVVFESKGWLDGKKATAHPAFADKLSDPSDVAARVVVDGKLITSRGPGTAFEFALTLVQHLYGPQVAKEVAGPMVMYDYQPAKEVVAA